MPQSTADQLWRAGRYRQNDPCAHYQTDGSYLEFWNNIDNSNSSHGVACDDPGTGWRLPSQSEWGELYKGGVFSGDYRNATANSWEWVSASVTKDLPAKNKYKLAGGYKIKPDDTTTTLFLPASGSRSCGAGLLYSQGTVGRYWSSSVSGTSAYNLHFYSSSVYPANTTGPAYGFALRCIKHI
jgi:uncharacterized protein (TIGR02145 family)